MSDSTLDEGSWMSTERTRRVNIASPAFTSDPDDPEGFRTSGMRIGPLVGAARTGMSVYELPPGQSICPYHYENPEEEWLLVLEGRPTLRRPTGEDVLGPWDRHLDRQRPRRRHRAAIERRRLLARRDR